MKRTIIISIIFLQLMAGWPVGAQSVDTATSTTDNQTLSINFLYPPTVVTNNSTIYARTNLVAENVKFYVYGVQNEIYPGQLSNSSVSYFYNYSFNWDVSEFPNGDYQLQAEAIVGNQKATSSSINIKIYRTANAALNIATATAPIIEIAASTTSSTLATIATSTLDYVAHGGLGIQIISPETGSLATSSAKIITKTFGGIKKVELFKMEGDNLISLGSDEPKSINYNWQYVWDVSTMSDGEYKLQSIALDANDNKIISNDIIIRVQHEKTIDSLSAATAQEILASSTDKEVDVSKPATDIISTSSVATSSEMKQADEGNLNKPSDGNVNPKSTYKNDNLKYLNWLVLILIICVMSLLYLRLRSRRKSQ